MTWWVQKKREKMRNMLHIIFCKSLYIHPYLHSLHFPRSPMSGQCSASNFLPSSFQRVLVASGRVRSPAVQKCPRKVIRKVLILLNSTSLAIFSDNWFTMINLWSLRLRLVSVFIKVHQRWAIKAIEKMKDLHWVTPGRNISYRCKLINQRRHKIVVEYRKRLRFYNMQISFLQRFGNMKRSNLPMIDQRCLNIDQWMDGLKDGSKSDSLTNRIILHQNF